MMYPPHAWTHQYINLKMKIDLSSLKVWFICKMSRVHPGAWIVGSQLVGAVLCSCGAFGS